MKNQKERGGWSMALRKREKEQEFSNHAIKMLPRTWFNYSYIAHPCIFTSSAKSNLFFFYY